MLAFWFDESLSLLVQVIAFVNGLHAQLAKAGGISPLSQIL